MIDNIHVTIVGSQICKEIQKAEKLLLYSYFITQIYHIFIKISILCIDQKRVE